jgi:hypothetical protein
MKILDDLAGFAVLTSPLWLILILLPVCIWLAFKIAKRFKSGIARAVGGVGIFLLLFALPFGDEIAGRIYLGYLCANEARVKVYQTVELPAEYWDTEGKARFLNARGVLIREVLGDQYEWRNIDESYVNAVIKIEKSRWELVENKTQNILGEKITYTRHFGWLTHFSPAPNIGESCRDVWAARYGSDSLFMKESSENREFFLRIFTPQTSSVNRGQVLFFAFS